MTEWVRKPKQWNKTETAQTRIDRAVDGARERAKREGHKRSAKVTLTRRPRIR